MLHKQISAQIIAAFYAVYNTLGYGFLEAVYHRSMLIELRSRGLTAVSKQAVDVFYRGEEVGRYFPDIIVNDAIIIEIKAMEALCPDHEAQLCNYLHATDIEVGLLINFGPKPSFIRRIVSNSNKRRR